MPSARETIYQMGRLVVEVSRLDAIVTELIALATSMHLVEAIIVVHHQQLGNKIDAFQALLTAGADKGDSDAINPLFVQIRKLAEYRNTMVHAFWSANNAGEISTTRFTARGKFQRSKRPVDAKELAAKADEAVSLCEQLETLRDSLSTILLGRLDHRRKTQPSK
jgi:hypothetical protein